MITRRFDYHTHNGYYRGSGLVWDVEQGWKQARMAKLDLLGISPKLESQKQDFILLNYEMIKKFHNNKILNGVEIDIRDPNGETLLDKNNLQYLDVILAGPHNVPYQTLAWPDLDEEDLEEYFGYLESILVNSLEGNPVDIWVHPFLQELEISAAVYYVRLESIFRKVLKICESQKIAVEINANYFRKVNPKPEASHFWSDSKEYYKEKMSALKLLFKIAFEEYNVKFTFASDSHDLIKVGDIDQCIDFAENIGIGDDDILFLDKKEK